MSDWELPKTDLGHPDSAIRLASAVHRFRVPKMSEIRKVSFARSFKTTGTHEKTRKVMLKADDAREKLGDAVLAEKVSHERVVADARRYLPFIHQILVSCKFQPEMARLDERLVFEWTSGVENDKKSFKSEAMMFDMVMCVVAEGLGKAGCATEASIAGEFAAASRDYAAAAGIFACLAEDHLPKWIARGSHTDEDTLPVECCVATADALKQLFMANGQQMAVATVLIKKGTPNYSLVAKLCLGIAEQLEGFVSHMRDNAFKQMARIDKDFFTLVTCQIQIQRSLSLYFHARSLWETDHDYGLAIAMMSEATVALRTRDSAAGKGVPDVTQVPALRALAKDLTDLRGHMALVLKEWEKDNSAVYFEAVPRAVPEAKKLQQSVNMKKMDKYTIADAEPVLLSLPGTSNTAPMASGGGAKTSLSRSDSDLARELQQRLNAGLDG